MQLVSSCLPLCGGGAFATLVHSAPQVAKATLVNALRSLVAFATPCGGGGIEQPPNPFCLKLGLPQA